jgi:VIT1/CCC1 family predicted Fe2+/Mn2+ transporter
MSSIDGLAGRRSVLDPVERTSEVVFGVLMALSFTGALSVATAGHGEIRTMMMTALGCNLAWGLTDAVIYLVGTFVERSRKVALLRDLVAEGNAERAHSMISDALPERLSSGAGPEALEAMRRYLIAAPVPRTGLSVQDFLAALEVFGLVVAATFPVVLPFVFIHETAHALRLSNLLSIATLFVCGHVLGRHARSNAWGFGFTMAGIGTALVGVIVALGG